MLYSWFMCLFALLPFCTAMNNIGDSCLYLMKRPLPDIAGICKPISQCPVAYKINYMDEKKPQMCRWIDDVKIVCCPLSDMWTRTGAGARFYEHSIDGIKRSKDVVCRYDGFQHMCCPNKPDRPPPPETGCPPLDKPHPPHNLNTAERIAWDKCAEYLRFVKPCVAKNGDEDRLIRVSACNIPPHRYRISGGQPALKNEFPHMAVLGVVEDPEDSSTDRDVEWVGGGALISDRFVLTAAHVLIDPASRALRYVLLGTLDKTDVLNGLLYTIIRKIPHPLYEFGCRMHDIALVETDRRVALSRFVRPICLPVRAHDTHAYERDIAGWGKTAENEGPSRYLYTTEVRIQRDHSECETKFKARCFHFNSSTMICAKGKMLTGNASDACRGDSGGPLMALPRNLQCSYTVEGVVSFGPHCGVGEAGVYTRVIHYLPWIVRQVWPDDWDKATAAEDFSRSALLFDE